MGQTVSSLPSRSAGRITYFDLLRIVAIYTTVVIHVISQVWYTTDIHSFSWKVYNAFLSGSCWGVPVFTMISGALFLDPDRTVDTGKLYSKNILRLVIAFCFWAPVYALVFDIRGKSMDKFFYSCFTGDFHMWYVVMILVMYMLTPLLRRFTDDLKLTGYFLKMSLVISFFIPQVLFLLGLLPIPYFNSMVQGLSKTFGDLAGYFPHFYLFYFVAGYYIIKTDLTPRQRKLIYLFGVLGYVSTVAATDVYSVFLGHESQYFQGKSTVNILLMALAVFTFAKYELGKIRFSENGLRVLRKASDCCLGIYFVHLLITKAAYGVFDLSTQPIPAMVRCIALPIAFFVCSFVTVLVMKRIPVLKKMV